MKIAYLLPTTELHGGIRVPLDQADELQRRGYDVEIWSPSGPPDWHRTCVPFRRVDIFSGPLPTADVCIATFWTTVAPACAAGAGRVIHLCQGFEGIHREYRGQLPEIDRASRAVPDKVVVSPHLAELLRRRYGVHSEVIGTGIDLALFKPRSGKANWEDLRIGVVGPYDVRPKGIPAVLEGLRLAREEGIRFELWRAASRPCTPEESKLGVTSRYFTRLPTTGMARFYQELDCLIHGSLNEEGFGLPPLEAGACGCAVAVSDIEPMAAFSRDAVLRFTPGCSEAVMRAARTLHSADQRRLLVESIHGDIKHFDIRAVVDRLETVVRHG